MRYKLEVFSTKFMIYTRFFDRKRDLLKEISSQLSLVGTGDVITITLDDKIYLPMPVELLSKEIPYVPAEQSLDNALMPCSRF